jgi:hypothetical protein
MYTKDKSIYDIQNLLLQIGSIRKKNAEILESSGGLFNMFRVCGISHEEIRHSAIIAELLNPRGSHGLKHKFLECFIETLVEDFTVKNFNCAKAEVFIEKAIISGSRLDILIKDEQNQAIIIENKRPKDDYTDGCEQLKKYDEFAKETYKDYQIFYLTLNGDKASSQSGDGVDYQPISYRKEIIDWLEKCVAIAARFPMVRETIIQYINHLKQLTNQDMDTKNKEEIVDMIFINHFVGNVEYIHGIWDDCKNRVIEKLLSSIKTTCEKLELRCVREMKDWDPSKRFTHLLFKKDGWNFLLAFEFCRVGNLGNLLIGVPVEDCKWSKEKKEEAKKAVRKLMRILEPEHWIFISEIEEWNKEPSVEKRLKMLDEKDNFIYRKTRAIVDVLNSIMVNNV